MHSRVKASLLIVRVINSFKSEGLVLELWMKNIYKGFPPSLKTVYEFSTISSGERQDEAPIFTLSSQVVTK